MLSSVEDKNDIPSPASHSGILILAAEPGQGRANILGEGTSPLLKDLPLVRRPSPHQPSPGPCVAKAITGVGGSGVEGSSVFSTPKQRWAVKFQAGPFPLPHLPSPGSLLAQHPHAIAPVPSLALGSTGGSKGIEGCSPITSTFLAQDWVGMWHKGLFRDENRSATARVSSSVQQ